ncbi:XdhC family protein [Actinoplanes sp. NEAU-A12]|uniref:XdhC family protein n=1 Tax=Actinoplanes sandaracinus TaxID=3045177 RepID=A0ABT6WL46_9ACTN|nr:XdhC/CoxI family protein [Actinoplanes sandaracinus]MDI6100448.1 XdhC family protein [Actinoplanes sandaracinus]
MREVLDDLLAWWSGDAGPAGLATVVATTGGSPRPVGAVMAVGPDGTVSGGVSGGCVEASVYDLAREAATDGEPRTGSFAASPDDVFAVGRPCGGQLDVYVERVDRVSFPEFGRVAAAIAGRVPVALVTCVEGAGAHRAGTRLVVTADGATGGPAPGRLRDTLVRQARRMLAEDRRGLVRPSRSSAARFFVATWAPAPRMLVLGSAHGAAAVARMGAFLGYHVTVCDPRPVFATARRFPGAHEVVVGWPDVYLRAEADAGRLGGRDVVCVMTHEARTAVPALRVATELPLAYVGVLGSRRAQRDLRDRMVSDGADVSALDRVSAPIGLDLGGVDSAETAVSIVAEIVALSRGGTGARLSLLRGAIHGAGPETPDPAGARPVRALAG